MLNRDECFDSIMSHGVKANLPWASRDTDASASTPAMAYSAATETATSASSISQTPSTSPKGSPKKSKDSKEEKKTD